jgi:hypothetical protein
LRGGDQRRRSAPARASGGENFRFLVISAGFARLKPLLPTKCRSTFRHRAPAASALPLVRSRGHWVRPELVAEVKYLTWTDDNLLQQVVYEGLRVEASEARLQSVPLDVYLPRIARGRNVRIVRTVHESCYGRAVQPRLS